MVTIVEAQSSILPQYDAELTRPVAKRLRELGVEVLTDAKAKGLAGGALSVEAADGRSMTLAADNILVTVGRKPVTEGSGPRRDRPRYGRPILFVSTINATPRCVAFMPSGT